MKGLIAVVVTASLAVAAYFLFLKDGPPTIRAVPFDPETAVNEIIFNIGATRGAFPCSVQMPDLPNLSEVCAVHGFTAAQARDQIDDILGGTTAKPVGSWETSDAGYSRAYRFDDNSYGESFIVTVSNDYLIVVYGYGY